MSKTLLYRLFKIGRIPKGALEQLRKEGVVMQEEGIGGTVTLKNFRSPTRRSGWRRSWFSGSIVLTEQHFLAFQYSTPVIGVAWNHEKIKTLNCFLEEDDTLCVAFDASTFNDDWSGDVEVRFTTPMAQLLLERIQHNITQQ